MPNASDVLDALYGNNGQGDSSTGEEREREREISYRIQPIFLVINSLEQLPLGQSRRGELCGTASGKRLQRQLLTRLVSLQC